MQNLIPNLMRIINSDFHIEMNGKAIEIIEIKEEASCKKVTFKSTNKNIFAFSLDKQLNNKCRMFPFFNPLEGELSKVTDGIIFCKQETTIFILLIELKSKHLNQYKTQLQASRNFALYLKNTLNLKFGKNYKIKPENIRCIVFSTRKIPQKSSSKRKNIKYTYDKVNNLYITEQDCNNEFIIQKFLQNIN